jgi:hypothetical protein
MKKKFNTDGRLGQTKNIKQELLWQANSLAHLRIGVSLPVPPS